MGVHLMGMYLTGMHLNLTTDGMQPFYLVVRTYLRLLVVAGISRFGAKSALAVLSGSPTAGGTLNRRSARPKGL